LSFETSSQCHHVQRLFTLGFSTSKIVFGFEGLIYQFVLEDFLEELFL